MSPFVCILFSIPFINFLILYPGILLCFSCQEMVEIEHPVECYHINYFLLLRNHINYKKKNCSYARTN